MNDEVCFVSWFFVSTSRIFCQYICFNFTLPPLLDYTIRIGSTPTFLYFDFYEMAFFYKMAILYRMVIWIYFIDVRWIFRDMIQGLEGVGLTIPTTHIRHIL